MFPRNTAWDWDLSAGNFLSKCSSGKSRKGQKWSRRGNLRGVDSGRGHPGLGPVGGCSGTLNTPPRGSLLGSGCQPVVHLSVNYELWPPTTNSLSVVAPLGAQDNFPQSGGTCKSSAANTRSSWTLEPQKSSWLGNIQKKQITELSRVENLLIYTKAPLNYTF